MGGEWLKGDNIMELSEETKEILKKYGWNETRKVDITKIKNFLESEGYTLFKSAYDFLSKFSGIYFEVPVSIKGILIKEKMHFDPIQASRDIWIENVQSYEKKVGEQLIPIGETNDYYYTLLLSESGKMYAGCDDLLYMLGKDYEDGIETLCRNLEKIQVF